MVCFHCFGHACLFSRFALVLLFGFGIPCCLGSNDIRFGSLVASSRALLFNLAQWLSLSLLAHINARLPKAQKADRRWRSPFDYGCPLLSFLMLFCCRWPASVPCFSSLGMRLPRPHLPLLQQGFKPAAKIAWTKGWRLPPIRQALLAQAARPPVLSALSGHVGPLLRPRAGWQP